MPGLALHSFDARQDRLPLPEPLGLVRLALLAVTALPFVVNPGGEGIVANDPPASQWAWWATAS